MAADERYMRERSFHDAAFTDDRRHLVAKYYAVDRASRRFYFARLATSPPGARVLEYGCGRGSAAFALARNGCLVTGIDISPEGIRQARARARAEGVEILFEVMNAEALRFANASFDVVCGSGILHHLDLVKAYSEISRVLTRDGRAIFIEPLGHNPLINLYRRATPGLRTADEHPLLLSDLRLASRSFELVRGKFFNLATFAAVPLRRAPGFLGVLAALEKVDRALFRLPAIRRFAWQVVLEFERPKPA